MQISPYDIDPSYIDKAARMNFLTSILIDDIRAGDYERSIVADTINQLATITAAIKSMIIKSETTTTIFCQKIIQRVIGKLFQNSSENLYWKHF